MPTYEFGCQDCGLIFTKMKKMEHRDDVEKCPECASEDVGRRVTAGSFAFSHVPVGGARPQNTGVHGIDYNYDKVIGEDAARKWDLIAKRQEHKRSVIRNNPGSTGYDLSRTVDGDYKVMKPEERKMSETGRALFQEIKKTQT